MEPVEGAGVRVADPADAGVGVRVDVVAVSVSYVAVSSDADTGVLITPPSPQYDRVGFRDARRLPVRGNVPIGRNLTGKDHV